MGKVNGCPPNVNILVRKHICKGCFERPIPIRKQKPGQKDVSIPRESSFTTGLSSYLKT